MDVGRARGPGPGILPRQGAVTWGMSLSVPELAPVRAWFPWLAENPSGPALDQFREAFAGSDLLQRVFLDERGEAHSALLYAVDGGQAAVVRALLAAGAPVSPDAALLEQDDLPKAREGLEVVGLLLDHGATPLAIDSFVLKSPWRDWIERVADDLEQASPEAVALAVEASERLLSGFPPETRARFQGALRRGVDPEREFEEFDLLVGAPVGGWQTIGPAWQARHRGTHLDAALPGTHPSRPRGPRL